MEKQYIIGSSQAGQRLDLALATLTGLSRSQLHKYFKSQDLTLNGVFARPSYLVQEGDVVELKLAQPVEASIEPPQLSVVYEDEDILVVNKPAGLLTHPVPDQASHVSVAEFARAHTSDPDPDRPGIVHRLDRDTSGLLIIAKHTSAKDYMQQQFASGLVHKTYLALVEGHPKRDQALIDLPIGRSKSAPVKRAVVQDGKSAQTEYKVISEYEHYSLLELKPRTGRTHQIRVHMAFIGHPVVGDVLYGRSNRLGMSRHFLHAAGLEFKSPSNQVVQLTLPLPAELQVVLDSLGEGYNTSYV